MQTKLDVGPPHDRYEQEADLVADQVMRMPEARARAQLVQTKSMPREITPIVRRQIEEEEEEEEEETPIQAKRISTEPASVNPLWLRMATSVPEGHRSGGQGATLLTKLNVGSPGDRYEQEADRVADRIMKEPDPARSATRSEVRLSPSEKPINRKMCAEREDAMLQRSSDGRAKTGSGSASDIAAETASRIESVRGGGGPLPASTRAFFEQHIGHDFSKVRVHTDRTAARLSENLNARAFTYGSDLFFGAGQYQPDSPRGRHLLAHELTHVVQQSQRSSGPQQKLLQRYGSGGYGYGQTDDCPEDFLKEYVWLGHDLAYKMVVHALYALCAAKYGNRTSRNKEARVQLATVFGSDWEKKSSDIYFKLWKLRSGLIGKFTYDCDTTGRIFCPYNPPQDIEWANTEGSSEINLCYENFRKAKQSLRWFALVVIHETGHRALGLGHGSDDESETCQEETSDTHCFALLAEGMWRHVNPEYKENNGDLCLGPGPTDKKLWDD